MQDYNSEDALLNLTNNLTADIETYQDIMLNWDMNGTIQSFWIPNVNSTTDSWSTRVREDYSANYFYSSQFVNDSIYLNVGGTSSDHLTFTNGSVKCPNLGQCNIIAKLSLDGILQDYIVGSNYIPSQGRHSTCSGFNSFFNT